MESGQASQPPENSEKRFRDLIDLLPQMYFETDVKGRFIYANRQALLSFGYSTEDLAQGYQLLQLVVPEDRPHAQAAFSRVCAGESTHGEEYTAVRKDGSTVPVLLYSAPIFVENQLRGIRGLVVDISERKRAEDALRRSQILFETCFRTSPAATILSIAADGSCVDVNDAYARMTGYTREELVGRSTLELGIWHDPEQRKRVVTELAQQRRMSGVEILIRTKQGALINTVASGEIISIDGRDHILSFFFDITDRKRAEEERLRFEQQMQQTQKLESLGILAGGIAHDFNNLLTGVFGFIDLAHRVSKDKQAIEYLDEARNAMGRARALTFQLLTFAKGGVPVRRTEPLLPFLKEAVHFALSGSNAACNFAVVPGLWVCNFDRNQISQLIDNIIINAVQAMPMGGTIMVSAVNAVLGEKEHAKIPGGKYVRISIADTGVGIPPELLQRIFDPFFTTKQKGSGLGLATCYSIAKRHGGCIDVESEQGKGSSFHVYLPAAEELLPASREAGAIPHKGSGRILLMDDDSDVQRVACAILEQFGYSCVCTSDGEEAVKVFSTETGKGNGFVCAILDLTVSGKAGGIKAVASIRAMDKNIPVFVSSGYAEDPALADPYRYGFTDSIQKPFSIEELASLLSRHLAGNGTS